MRGAPGGKGQPLPASRPAHLPQRLAELAQDAVLVEHLALVAVLVVVVDALPRVGRELVEGHVLLHLLVLRPGQRTGRHLLAGQPHCLGWYHPASALLVTKAGTDPMGPPGPIWLFEVRVTLCPKQWPDCQQLG